MFRRVFCGAAEGQLLKNISRTKTTIRWGLDRVDVEWAGFEVENAADPKKGKNSIQNDGEVCQGEHAN